MWLGSLETRTPVGSLDGHANLLTDSDGSGDHGSHDLRGAAGVCAGVIPIEWSFGGVIVSALGCDCSV